MKSIFDWMMPKLTGDPLANREKINEKRRRKYREKRIRNQDGV